MFALKRKIINHKYFPVLESTEGAVVQQRQEPAMIWRREMGRNSSDLPAAEVVQHLSVRFQALVTGKGQERGKSKNREDDGRRRGCGCGGRRRRHEGDGGGVRETAEARGGELSCDPALVNPSLKWVTHLLGSLTN